MWNMQRSFSDAAKSKTIAATQYAASADIVYQVAGGTGAGASETQKSINETEMNQDLGYWDDRDQNEEE